jgi:hypothetical protein
MDVPEWMHKPYNITSCESTIKITQYIVYISGIGVFRPRRVSFLKAIKYGSPGRGNFLNTGFVAVKT